MLRKENVRDIEIPDFYFFLNHVILKQQTN